MPSMVVAAAVQAVLMARVQSGSVWQPLLRLRVARPRSLGFGLPVVGFCGLHVVVCGAVPWRRGLP